MLNFRKLELLKHSSGALFICDCCTLPFHPIDKSGFSGVAALSYQDDQEMSFCPICFESNFCQEKIYELLNKNHIISVFPQLINPKIFNLKMSLKPIFTLALIRIFAKKEHKHIYSFIDNHGVYTQFQLSKNLDSIDTLYKEQKKLETLFVEKNGVSNIELIKVMKAQKIPNVVPLPTVDRVITLIEEGVMREEEIASTFNIKFQEE